MTFLLWSSVAALAATAAAKECMNFTVPVMVSSRNGVFNNTPIPQSNMDATTFIANFTTQGGNYSAVALTGYATISNTYNISAQYCMPSKTNSSAKKVLQVLTHGIGFDKTYWDLAYDNFNYSYVDVATDDAGYYTFSYDRLGIGNSSHGDPRNEIQAPLEVAALVKMTQGLRSGSLQGVNQTFDAIVHVGHSFGSDQTFALSAMYPNLTDGIVLTGFSTNSSFMGYFAAGGNYKQANLTLNGTQAVRENYPRGYLVNADIDTLQYQFLHAPNYDPRLAQYGEQGRQPVTIGELLTVGGGPMMTAYTGPVLVFTGEYDLPFCGGNCTATGQPNVTSIPAAAMKAFPKAKSFEAYLQPDTGHGLNFHYNATAGYQYIQSWLAKSIS